MFRFLLLLGLAGACGKGANQAAYELDLSASGRTSFKDAPPETEDPVLQRLTVEAGTLARDGNCPAVRMAAAAVAERDADYRRSGFLADAMIRGCLE